MICILCAGCGSWDNVAVSSVLAHKRCGHALEMQRCCLEMPRLCPQMQRPSVTFQGGGAPGELIMICRLWAGCGGCDYAAVFPVLAHKRRGHALEMQRFCLEMPRQCPQMTRPSAKKNGGGLPPASPRTSSASLWQGMNERNKCAWMMGWAPGRIPATVCTDVSRPGTVKLLT